ncbi:IS630 transposase-related protein [uncultured Nitrospira sp.]|uniref:IS630 transposase-related protein n=1 Tax=uncultured Nitrospira sp. TaxID=157176 RepID=UPI0031408365
MSNAYSIDLRVRAMTFVLEGGRKKMACKIFNIGRDTLYRWTRQYQMQGHVTPKARGKYVVRKLDDAVLVSYIATHPDATLEELGREFAVSAVAIWKACRRLQITRKKNDAVRRTKRRGPGSGSGGPGRSEAESVCLP